MREARSQSCHHGHRLHASSETESLAQVWKEPLKVQFVACGLHGDLFWPRVAVLSALSVRRLAAMRAALTLSLSLSIYIYIYI